MFDVWSKNAGNEQGKLWPRLLVLLYTYGSLL